MHDKFVLFGLSAIYILFSVILLIKVNAYNQQHKPTWNQKIVRWKSEKNPHGIKIFLKRFLDNF